VGDGSTTNRLAPVAVSPPTGVTYRQVAPGGDFTLALSTTGQVYAWGSNTFGQLGDGGTSSSVTPQLVDLPVGVTVTAVSAGADHGLALTSTGQIYAWGQDDDGQLGNSTSTGSSDEPQLVAAPTGVAFSQLAAGSYFSLALSTTGQVYGWGANFLGQLGDGTTHLRQVPVPVAFPASFQITAIAAGATHSLAVTSTGSVYAWGGNGSGQLGNGTTVPALSPAQVTPVAGQTFTTVAAGAGFSMALTASGNVYSWGSGTEGQLGVGVIGAFDVPQRVNLRPLLPITAIAAGYASGYALGQDGSAYSWGDDFYGGLGNGSTSGVLAPQAITVPDGANAAGVFSSASASGADLLTGQDQTVNLGAIPDQTYGANPILVQASATSGQPVTLRSQGGCSYSGSYLFINAAGNCTLTGTQVGNDQFNPANPSSITFKINQAPLTLIAGHESGVAGGPLPPLNYSFTGFVKGNGPSAVQGQADCVTDANASSPPGTYPVWCGRGTLSSANYFILPTTVAGSVTLIQPTVGYAVVGADGSVSTKGPGGADSVPFEGSMAGQPLNAPIVGSAFTPFRNGYWLVARDGGIFSFGSAAYYGSMGGHPLNAPIVGMTATPDGKGYWLVASDGGIFSFGDARFFGSMGGQALNAPIVGMAPSVDGGGYWMVASDGGVFTFGDAPYEGSAGSVGVESPVVGLAPTPDGRGYWLATALGGVFSYGDAPFEGSLQYVPLNSPVVSVAPSPVGDGYWMASADGGVFAFGAAGFFGSDPGVTAPVVSII
jgi:alpha-tubulin suppressor-like RCC1 family protein